VSTTSAIVLGGRPWFVSSSRLRRPRPFVRVADRVAVLFVPLTVAVAAAAWLASGDPVRAVAVLVLATPCPLLLAVPVAIISGLSRTDQLGVETATSCSSWAMARALSLGLARPAFSRASSIRAALI
jgi:hypothetical protein